MTHTLLEAAVWLGPLLVLYVYLVFPLAMALVSRQRRAGFADASAVVPLPVTVIVPAYNEERSIGARIENLLASSVPQDRLEIIVVSDASTDRTDEIARSFESRGVRLIVQEARRGKTAGLNRAMQIARGEVAVFTDANSVYAPDTISRLVAAFADPRVGLVSGYTKYTLNGDGEVAEATNAYTSLERTIKRAESQWGCCVGADGAIFAMRRSLYRTLRDDDINDLVLPLTVIDQGFRCVLAEDAYCSENPGENLESEFKRQSRITNRSLRAIWRRPHLLHPVRFPAFSFFLFSHKVLRFLAPVFLCFSTVALAALAPQDGRYLALAAAAALVMLPAIAAMVGLASSASWLRPIRLVTIFLTMNAAMLHGWWKFLAGRTDVTWRHDRAVTG